MYSTHTHTHKREEGKARGNERQGEIENERRKRENKHAPNRLAIEREGKKGREGERTVPKEKHKKTKGKRERGSLRRLAATKGSD